MCGILILPPFRIVIKTRGLLRMRNISNRYYTEKKRMSTFGGGYQSFDYANNYRGGGGVGASGSGFGGGGFGGGGYMSDVTVAGGGFSSPSVVQSPGMTKSRSGRDDSVRSIVSAQLHSIPLADISSQEIKIDDKELGQVCLVGEIIYVSENSTGTTYKIDDRTGPPIEIKRWISDDESPLEYQNRAACREGIYVKVIGHVRVFGNQRNVVGFFIKPIEDYNEVTHHLVETLFAHLAITKPLPVPEQYSSLANNMGGDTSGWAPMATSTQIGGSAAMYSDGGLTPVQRQVLNIINQCHTADGLHVNEIHSMAAVSGYKDGQIKSAIDFLASEGHIYSTIDDHHFMSTEN